MPVRWTTDRGWHEVDNGTSLTSGYTSGYTIVSPTYRETLTKYRDAAEEERARQERIRAWRRRAEDHYAPRTRIDHMRHRFTIEVDGLTYVAQPVAFSKRLNTCETAIFTEGCDLFWIRVPAKDMVVDQVFTDMVAWHWAKARREAIEKYVERELRNAGRVEYAMDVDVPF